jgi:hypothetical protein
MATSREGFCRVCKIGTLDAEGLCVLCGAPSVPLSRPRRAVGTLLAALTSLPAVALYAVLATGGGALALWNYLGPDRAPAIMRGPVGGGLSTGVIVALIVGPALLALVVMIVLFLLGRRGGRPSRHAAETY